VLSCTLPISVLLVGSVALLLARRTNDRKDAGSRPTRPKVVCITVLKGNRMGVNCPLWPAAPLLPSCRKLEFRLSALMDSDLAWVNGMSGRQSWRYADSLQRSIISEAIYHLFILLQIDMEITDTSTLTTHHSCVCPLDNMKLASRHAQECPTDCI